MVSNLSNLTVLGYHLETELGRNREGGRITWKATNISDGREVAIKQFCFATANSTWSGYQAYEREIELLSKLKHPGIPSFIDSLETDNGFCLIQEYKNAPKLSDLQQLDLAATKQILLQILDILIYLQQQNPPVFHRDLKPENILVGDWQSQRRGCHLNSLQVLVSPVAERDRQVYLVDFGFASLGSKEASVSSIFKGTPGFMPPEQITKPTKASDLYSLGVTAICMLTQKNSWEIGELASEDNPYRLQFKPHLPPLNRKFVGWLDKMVQPQASKRFSDAAAAKAALEEIEPNLTENSVIKVNFDRLLSLDRQAQKTILGTVTLASLSTVAVSSVNFALHHLDRTLVNLAIFILSAVVITVTELAAATIATTDETVKKPAITIAIAMPILLVFIAWVMLGKQQVIAIAASITIAEIFSFSYFWLQQPLFEEKSLIISIYWLATICLGASVGLTLIF